MEGEKRLSWTLKTLCLALSCFLRCEATVASYRSVLDTIDSTAGYNCLGSAGRVHTVIAGDVRLLFSCVCVFLQTLTFMLEVEVLQGENEKLQIISTLESTEEGQECYEALCQKYVSRTGEW